MISIELVRNEPGMVRESMRKRGEDVPIARVLELDSQRRSAIAEGDALRAHRNEVSWRLGQMKERPPELIEEMRGVGDQIRALEDLTRSLDKDLDDLLLTIPNIPREDVPIGEDETGNVVVRTAGELPSFDFDRYPTGSWAKGWGS